MTDLGRKMVKNNLSQRLQSTFLMVAICFILCISMVSAFEFDNIIDLPTIEKDVPIMIGDVEVEYKTIWEKYEPIDIINWLGLGETLFSGAITEHDDVCGIDCSSTMQIYLANDGVLIDEVIFKTLQEDNSWIEQNVRSYKFSYLGLIDDYETICILGKETTYLNGTSYIAQECSEVKIGSHYGWINYKLGEEVKAGNYKIKLDAQKKPSRTVDWIIKTNGEWLESWATWGNISEGDDAEVILNSPADDYILLTNPQEFNCSANVTEGTTLTNISLWTNESGSWENKNTTLFSDITNAHNKVLSVLHSETGVVGAKVTMKETVNLDKITKSSSTTSTRAILQDVSHNVLATANFSGDIATFNYRLQNGVSYYVLTDSFGDSANHYYKSGAGFPISNTSLNWIGGYFNGADTANDLFDIVSISVSSIEVTQIFNRTLTDTTLWTCQACDSDGDCGFATENRTLLIDITIPTFQLISGNGTQNYGSTNVNHTINTTITDTNLDTCWYDYNETNNTFSCSTGINDFNFTLEEDIFNLTLWANDSVGNENYTFVSWNYYVFETSQSYTAIVTEGATSLFSSNLTMSSGKRLTSADLIYNGTSYSGSNTEYATNKYYIYRNLNIPQVSAQTNITFYWNLSFEDDTIISTVSNNQTINPMAIDNCSSYTNILFNFTLVDEDSQSFLPSATENISIKSSIVLINPNNNEQILNFSQEFTANYASICFDDELASESYRLDGVIEYSAKDKFIEYYNFQNYTLNNETMNQNITLYNLNSSKGQEFKITYKDANFNLVPGALIQIQRKYVDEGVFKTVEIPMISSAGYTMAHLIVDDVIYNLVIIDEGTIVATFSDIVAACQNPSFTDCEININSFSTGINPEDFTTDGEFSGALAYNKTTKVVSITYAIVSGIPAVTTLSVNLYDALGNTSVCNDSLNSAGGFLSCTVPDSFGNSSIIVKVISDGDVKRTAIVRLNEDPIKIYGANLVFLSLIIMITLIGMSITDNPVVLGIMLIFGSIMLISLNLVSTTGWIGSGATILWFIVAIIILFIKGSNRQ